MAHAARDYRYALILAAGRMSSDTVKPADFLDFVQRQGIHASAGDYLPRQAYGERPVAACARLTSDRGSRAE